MTQRQSFQWKHAGSPRPKKARQSKSTHKILMIPFFDSTGMIYMHWVHNSILVTDYLTRMGIKTVPYPPYSPDLASCDFWLFPKLKEKLRGCRYETIEKLKEAVMKVIDMLTQEDFHGAFQKLLDWYNKCNAAEGDYFEGDKNFMCVLSIKVPIRKKSGNLFNDPCIYLYI